MTSKPFIVKPVDRGPALNVIGTQVTVLASEKDIRDQQITVQSGDEGTGPPPHSHDWDESFYVTKGLIEFTCGGETSVCGAGTLVHVPPAPFMRSATVPVAVKCWRSPEDEATRVRCSPH